MTSPSPALRLHHGETVHRRFTPFVSDFSYKVFMIELDIDRLDDADRQCRLFGVDRGALFSFRPKDHGEGGSQSLRNWAEARFRTAGVDASSLRLRLMTFPRHLFHKFAPISLWLAETEDGSPAGVLYEVRNTFGERHTYVSAIEGKWTRHVSKKDFHVSPFFDLSGNYEFSLQRSDDRLKLGVTTMKDGAAKHMATLSTAFEPATDKALLRAAVTMPASTLGVTLGIHWEALKLWLKGADYHAKPHQNEQTVSIAAPSGRTIKETQG